MTMIDFQRTNSSSVE